MESIYASKWMLETGIDQLSQLLDNTNRLIARVKTASVVRDDCRADITQAGRTLIHKIIETQTCINDMLNEIELAMKIYRVDYPEHKPRFFLFDNAGAIRSVSQEEYNENVPKEEQEGTKPQEAEETEAEEEEANSNVPVQ